jgi:glycosyltransferase involved in cell wall biosynthesis
MVQGQMEIHQFLPGFHYGDAISNEALALRRLLRSWGHSSRIYCVTCQDKVALDCHHYSAYQHHDDAISIYHYSIGCEELTQLFRNSPGKRILIYHNITPHEFFEPYNPFAYQACRAGRAELASLHDATDVALGDSAFNCRELAWLGFSKPQILPIAIDFARFDVTEPCPAILSRYADDWTNFIFVGRISPNKRPDDVIRAFAHYQRRIKRRSRLFLVGCWGGFENYLAELHDLVDASGLADHVVFSGHVRFRELVAYYKLAHLFLCMSEHEGFCVPLLEALHYDIPVLAYQAAAVPDTLGDAGILVSKKDFSVIAEMAHLLVSDQNLRDRVIRRQGQRLADFRPEPIARQLKGILEEITLAA